MSNASETLKKVKAVLGLEIKMETLKMENGTILEAEKFESGEPVFIVTEDEKVALPIGAYELEDKKVLVVEEEGIIAKLDEHEEEAPAEEVEEEELEYVSKEEFYKEMEAIKMMIEEVKNMDHGKDKMAEEVKEETEELKEELSKPAVQPFKHSPEKNTTKREVIELASKRPMSMLDVVFGKLNK